MEGFKTSELYRKHSRRIHGTVEDEDAAEELDQMFTDEQYGRNLKDFEKKAKKLMDQYDKEKGAEGDLGDESGDSDGVEGQGEIDKSDKEVVPSLSEDTKLFSLVTSRYPKQVLRYTLPKHDGPEPLWTSRKQKMKREDVPKCPKCGSVRRLEVQITPQMFDFCAPLRWVDWETIVMYSCPNLAKCLPEMGNDEHFLQEFAWI